MKVDLEVGLKMVKAHDLRDGLKMVKVPRLPDPYLPPVRSVQELLHPPTAHLHTTLPPTVATYLAG